MEAGFVCYRKLSEACKAAIHTLGMRQVSTDLPHAAATLTAPYYPKAVTGTELLRKVKSAGAILAGGLHPKIKDRHFRIGHMAVTKVGELLESLAHWR